MAINIKSIFVLKVQNLWLKPPLGLEFWKILSYCVLSLQNNGTVQIPSLLIRLYVDSLSVSQSGQNPENCLSAVKWIINNNQ